MKRLICFSDALKRLSVVTLLLSSALVGHVMAYDYSSIKQQVNAAIEENTAWSGPITGPKISSKKQLIFVASDLRNDGVNSIAKGMTDAISNLDWNLRLLDGNGSKVRQAAVLSRAIMLKPDGIVLGGIDAKYHEQTLQAAQKLGITVIGWHAANTTKVEPELGLFTNITTDAQKVGEIAASLAIVDAKEHAKVVIFTDSNYSIAMLKAHSMAEAIKQCVQCELLSIEDIPLDNIADEMPDTIARLLQQYPRQITHFLVINDLYIDFAIPSLIASGQNHHLLPKSISAGDGSFEAYQRIRNQSFQLATVPEPLFMQGWQIVDEFNRAFHNMLPSQFETPIHLVVHDNVRAIDRKIGVHDPQNNYREAYMRIWK